jgi:hypothetical protein
MADKGTDPKKLKRPAPNSDSEDEEGHRSPAKKKVKATGPPRTPSLLISPTKTSSKTVSRSGTRSNTRKGKGKMLSAAEYENRRNYHGDAGTQDGCKANLRWNSPSLCSGNEDIHLQQTEMFHGAYISAQLAGQEENGVYLATQISLPINTIRIHVNTTTGRRGKYPHTQQVPPLILFLGTSLHYTHNFRNS